MEAAAHAIAGSTGGVVAMTLLYPLENIRTRLQVQVKSTKREKENGTTIPKEIPDGRVTYDPFKGSLDCIRQVIQKEGWKGLYTGLSSALFGIGYSSAVYFFWYYLFKQRWLARTQKHNLGPIENLGIASLAGILNVFMTAPVWVINTRMKLPSAHLKYKSDLHALFRIYQEEGLAGLYQGLIPSLILVSNPAIQFMAYEQMTRFMRRLKGLGHSDKLSAAEYFILGAIAKALATVATYPYQVLKSRLQAEETAHLYKGTFDATIKMLREEGISSFFLGMNAKMSQTVLNSAFMFAVYENLLHFSMNVLKLFFSPSTPAFSPAATTSATPVVSPPSIPIPRTDDSESSV